MWRELLDRMACPLDGYPLTLRQAPAGGTHPAEAGLRCSRCGALYPIAQNIGHFLAPVLSHLEEEQVRQLDGFDLFHQQNAQKPLDTYSRMDLDAIDQVLGAAKNRWVLDAGCGRELPGLAQAAGVVAVDFSLSSLQALGRSFPKAIRIQADALHLPFQPRSFDVVLCRQVLPYIIRPDLRASLLRNLASMVRPEGTVIISTMHYNFRYPKLGMPKYELCDGIYSRRDTLQEFQAELEPYFDVQEILGLWTYLPNTYPLYCLLGEYQYTWDRFWRHKKLSHTYGKKLLAVCRPKRQLRKSAALSGRPRSSVSGFALD